jgi:hypothetical protein
MSNADERRRNRRAVIPQKLWTREEVDAILEGDPIAFTIYCDGRRIKDDKDAPTHPRYCVATFRWTIDRRDGQSTWEPHWFWTEGERFGRIQNFLEFCDDRGHVIPDDRGAVFTDPGNIFARMVSRPDGSDGWAEGSIRAMYRFACHGGYSDNRPCRNSVSHPIEPVHRILSKFAGAGLPAVSLALLMAALDDDTHPRLNPQ